MAELSRRRECYVGERASGQVTGCDCKEERQPSALDPPRATWPLEPVCMSCAAGILSSGSNDIARGPSERMDCQGSALTGSRAEPRPSYLLPKQARPDIDGQRQDHGVEQKAQQPMRRRQPAQRPRGDLHVGNLERHAQHQGEVEEIPVVRRLFARGSRAPRRSRSARAGRRSIHARSAWRTRCASSARTAAASPRPPRCARPAPSTSGPWSRRTRRGWRRSWP